MVQPSIEVDAPLDLSEVDNRFWNVLRQFAPFGPENMRPIFLARGLEVVGRPKTVGGGGAHLKLQVRSGTSLHTPPHAVIAFGMGGKLPDVLESQREGQPLEMVFCIEENTWKGRTSLQLCAKDLRLEKEGPAA
jgi:single-stranded-DNA-specific exonuclease